MLAQSNTNLDPRRLQTLGIAMRPTAPRAYSPFCCSPPDTHSRLPNGNSSTLSTPSLMSPSSSLTIPTMIITFS